jgi:hypothetical protein
MSLSSSIGQLSKAISQSPSSRTFSHFVFMWCCDQSPCSTRLYVENFRKHCFICYVDLCKQKKIFCMYSGLNTGPAAHETTALPMSYCVCWLTNQLILNIKAHWKQMLPHSGQPFFFNPNQPIRGSHDESTLILNFQNSLYFLFSWFMWCNIIEKSQWCHVVLNPGPFALEPCALTLSYCLLGCNDPKCFS